MKKIKQILVGKECQVDPENIPLITDILDQPELYEQSKNYHDDQIEVQNCMWQPNRLPSKQVDYYISQVKKHWPHDQYPYQEDRALEFLHFKNYSV
jgi:hypothetical protein